MACWGIDCEVSCRWGSMVLNGGNECTTALGEMKEHLKGVWRGARINGVMDYKARDVLFFGSLSSLSLFG